MICYCQKAYNITQNVFNMLCKFLFCSLTSKHPVLGVVENLILNYTSSAHHPATDCDYSANSRPKSNRAKNQICDVLKLDRKQRRMCKKKCVAQTLLKAAQLSTSECQRLFRFDRWNCSIGKFRTKLLRQGKGKYA